MTDANEGTPKRTPEEKQILEVVKERKDEEWVDEHAELILAQAKLVGAL